MTCFEKAYGLIVEGRLLKYIYLVVFIGLFSAVLISGIDFSKNETIAAKSTEIKRYIVKKVSSLPKEENDEMSDEEKKASEDALADIRRKYISYVIAQIEKNKVYPKKEQSLGHQGVVKFILELKSDGSVSRFSYVQKSIYSSLNNSSIQAVKKANPFPRFPTQLKAKKMRIPVLMDYHIQ
jgi:TonB family protein